MERYWRYGHLSKVFVVNGQEIKKGDLIANLGGTGGWSPHLHIDCMTYKPSRWTEYVIGKSKKWVQDHYFDLHPYITPTIPTKYDHLGYDWLEFATYSGGTAYHPGLDINGPGAGASDLGNAIYSVCDGKVEYVYDGNDKNAGWGKMIIIQESEPEEPETKPEIEPEKPEEPEPAPEPNEVPIVQPDAIPELVNESDEPIKIEKSLWERILEIIINFLTKWNK